MACGLPVILSNIDPHKEIFEALNSYPYFFNSNDIETLMALIEKIILSDYRKLSQQMLSLIEENFSAEINANRYMVHYNKHLSK